MICAGCNKEKSHKARGLCNSCYVTWGRTGSTERVRQPRGAHCSVDGCSRIVKGRGLCEMHYARLRKTGALELKVRDANNSPTLHTLYPQWVDFKRSAKLRAIVPEWGEDFWAFVAAVGERPSGRHRLYSLNKTEPLGPGNYEWRETSTPRLADETDQEYKTRYRREHRAANVDMYRGHQLARHYGITTEQYDAMAEDQGHACAICHKPETLIRKGSVQLMAVDHDHATGAVRGLLCDTCNKGLGMFKDDTTLLAKAIAYLASHQA